MGLLGNLDDIDTLVRFLTAYPKIITWVPYVAGIVWWLLLSHRTYNDGTYFSENALLPGLVDGEFYSEQDMNKFYADLIQLVKINPNGIPAKEIGRMMSDIGLETYVHNFSIRYPLNPNEVYHGRNVYGILRSKRTASTEGIVFSVPYRPPNSPNQDTVPGIAVMLGLAKFFRNKVYWAKDIIFLVTEHEQLGTQAWLDAYYQGNIAEGVLFSGDLMARSGMLQAAINLELPSTRIHRLDVKIEGLNGQLPNLDLFNMVVRMCNKEGVRVSFKDRFNPRDYDTFSGWVYAAKTMIHFMFSQATGVPSGNHGLFHRYQIDALTLQGHVPKGTGKVGSTGFNQVGRVLEGVFRSLNNLMEKFHQSYFFYILPEMRRYISIAYFMPALGLVALPVVVMCLLSKLQLLKQEKDRQKPPEDSGKAAAVTGAGDGALRAPSNLKLGLTAMFVPVAILHAKCWTLAVLPPLLADLGISNGWPIDVTVSGGLVGYMLFFAAFAVVVSGFRTRTNISWHSARCVALMELALLLGAVGMLNFSLAFFAAIILSPVLSQVRPVRNRVGRMAFCVLVLAVSPMALLYFASLFDTWRMFPNLPAADMAWRALVSAHRSLIYLVVDSYIYSNWLFGVVVYVGCPVWLQFWSVLFMRPYV